MPTVRPAREADVAALADLHVRCWREAYRNLLSEQYLAGLSVEDRAAIWRQILAAPGAVTAVAEAGGELVGSAWALPSSDGPRPLVLAGIYLLQAWHGSGIGQSLLDAAIGDAACFLWVAEDNPRAHAFYGRNGFVADGARQLLAEAEDLPVVRFVRG